MADVIFTDGMFCDSHTFESGDSITKLSFKSEQFKQWLDTHTNDKGYVNVIVSKSQSSGKLYGRLDTWQPKQQEGQQQAPQQQAPQNNFQESDQPVDNIAF